MNITEGMHDIVEEIEDAIREGGCLVSPDGFWYRPVDKKLTQWKGHDGTTLSGTTEQIIEGWVLGKKKWDRLCNESDGYEIADILVKPARETVWH